ncbi:YheC/YheD family protein [Bacillus sp. B-jedd]|uniref:YheC/YheD family protein n=1 Tax=Bacillus sp. B-jedd TaxID=1476857 RepID=UPI0005157211|nr:YheC/YheD family protein [Bacillus sp. B-jedd]CEG29311.1 spore coat associated protein [Bacillus sp. B-jedd]
MEGITLLVTDSTGMKIEMNRKMAIKAGLFKNREIDLSYGMRKVKVKLLIKKRSAEDKIFISGQAVEKLKIERSVPYNCSLEGNCLVIGPVLGMLFKQNSKNLEQALKENPAMFFPYARSIKGLGGLLFFFAEDGIDYDASEISGYFYDFETMSWKQSVFPFPAIIYRKIKASRALKEAFGRRLINPPCYYKWKFYSILKENQAFEKYLPETTNVITKENLDSFLQKYGKAFLKMSNQGGGVGMHLIWKEGEEYLSRQNFTDDTFRYSSAQMIKLLKVCEKNHILQQPIDIKAHQGRQAIYRVIAVKEHAENWKVRAIHGWLGEQGGISTQAYGLTARYPDDLLRMQFEYPPRKVKEKIREMEKLAVALAEHLENACGTFVDFGFDFGLDEKGDIYIFEGNTLQQLEMALWLGDQMMYGELIHRILTALKEMALGN